MRVYMHVKLGARAHRGRDFAARGAERTWLEVAAPACVLYVKNLSRRGDKCYPARARRDPQIRLGFVPTHKNAVSQRHTMALGATEDALAHKSAEHRATPLR